jgi:hypothetical protein
MSETVADAGKGDPFSATKSLTRGYERLGSSNAWVLIMAMVFISVLIQQTVFGRSLSGYLGLAGLLIMLLYPFLIMALLIVSFRVFVQEPEKDIFSNVVERTNLCTPIIFPTLNGIIGSLIFFALYFLGLAVFVLPGIFVGATLGFFFVFVAVDNDRFTTAMLKSWRLTSGNRAEMIFMMFALLVLTVGYFVVTFLAWNVPIAGAIVGGAALIYYVAVFSEAYRMLSGVDSEEQTPQ